MSILYLYVGCVLGCTAGMAWADRLRIHAVLIAVCAVAAFALASWYAQAGMP